MAGAEVVGAEVVDAEVVGVEVNRCFSKGQEETRPARPDSRDDISPTSFGKGPWVELDPLSVSGLGPVTPPPRRRNPSLHRLLEQRLLYVHLILNPPCSTLGTLQTLCP